MKRLLGVFIFAVALAHAASAQIGSGPGTSHHTRSIDTLFGQLFIKDTVKGTPVWLSAQTIASVGTTTNDNATAGNVGEIITGSRATGSSLSLTSPNALTVDSVSLTAGDWDVTGVVAVTGTSTTSITYLSGGISTTTNTIGALGSYFGWATAANVFGTAHDPVWATPVVRVSVASTTTVFLVAQATFSASTLKGYGAMRARRVR